MVWVEESTLNWSDTPEMPERSSVTRARTVTSWLDAAVSTAEGENDTLCTTGAVESLT